jgi:hypothetical protein
MIRCSDASEERNIAALWRATLFVLSSGSKLSMPIASRKPSPSADRRRALRVLADSSDGCTEALMMAHGFKLELLAGLIRDGLATTSIDRVGRGGRPVEVVRLRITETGRKALT